ncbi:MAG TPA: TonB-dependent receptor [Rhizomicrobium sp.]|jgi:iron complex outermembrane receptor protein|nr:TonB-dependent receptor [Rhizomicrobium sp.]
MKRHNLRALACGAMLLCAVVQAEAQTSTTSPASQPAASPFAPNGAIEEVVVTARRRAEDVQKVPAAVTAIPGEELRETSTKSALDLQNLAPSLSVAANLGSRDSDVFTIRGQTQPFGGADPGVQPYFAEVPFNPSGPGSYFDLDSIQVLNGPQGTLFGRNTTGGAVLFEPKKPEDGFGGYVDGELGNFNMAEIQGALNVPIIDDAFLVRAAADIASRDGYTRDITFDEELDNVEYESFRIGATMRPFAGFENYLVFDYLHDHNNGTSAELTGVNVATIDNLATEILGAPCTTPPTNPTCAALEGFEGEMLQALRQQQGLGPRATTSSIPLFFRRETWSAIDIASYDVTPQIRLRNIFGYLSDKQQPAFDYDGSALPILDIPNPRTWESNSLQVSEEFQVLGETPDNVLNWIVGYYHELDHPGGYSEVERETLGGAQPPGSPFADFGTTEIDSLSNGGTSNAAYASATYDAASWVQGLSLTAGGRYTWDHKIAVASSCILPQEGSACPFPIPDIFPYAQPTRAGSFRAPTWTLAANYQVTGDTMVYATYRRGYKSGGFNSGAGAASDFAEFKPEFLTDVEAGTKNNWTILGVPGRTDFDLYYGWYDDVQKNDLVAVEQELTTPPFIQVEPVALTFNAARATIKGLEFQSTFVPDDNFEVNVFYSYTDASYSSFVLPQAILIDLAGNQTELGALNHAGNPFSYTPQNKLGISPRFHFPVEASLGAPTLSAQIYWQSSEWFTDLSDIETTCGAFIRPNMPGAPYTCLAPAGQPPEQKDYVLVNLRFDWENLFGNGFDASVFANNVLDKTYQVGADALLHLTGTSASIYAPPRMWGVEIRYRFGADAPSP